VGDSVRGFEVAFLVVSQPLGLAQELDAVSAAHTLLDHWGKQRPIAIQAQSTQYTCVCLLCGHIHSCICMHLCT
jgi:hypothetical protein